MGLTFTEDKESTSVSISGDTYSYIKLFKTFGGVYDVEKKHWKFIFTDKLKNTKEISKYIDAQNLKELEASKQKWKKACQLNDCKYVSKTDEKLYNKVLQTFKDLPTLTE